LKSGFKDSGQIANFPPGKTRYYLSQDLEKRTEKKS
jgi:hypothetical protein